MKIIYEKLIAGVAKKIATLEIKKESQELAELVAETIKGLVNLLSAELEMQTKTCLALCSSIGPIFKTSEKFYK